MPFTKEEAEVLRQVIGRLDRRQMRGTNSHRKEWANQEPGYYCSQEVYDFMQSSNGLYFDTWAKGALEALLEGDLKLAKSLSEPQYSDPALDTIEPGDFVVYVGPVGEFTTFSGEVKKVANGLCLCNGRVRPGDKFGVIWKDEVLFAPKDLLKLGRA